MSQNLKRMFVIIMLVVLAGGGYWLAGPQHPRLKIGQWTRDLNIKLGLDLQGGAHLIYRADVSKVPAEDQVSALGGVRDVIERRVNTFGVTEPIVQTNHVGDEQRIIVELAGVFDVNEAISLIGATPQLDFRQETVTASAPAQNIDGVDNAGGLNFVRSELSGRHLKRASVGFDQISGIPSVNLEFNSEGADLFASLTRDTIGRRLAIYLDDVPISAPVVQSEITNGQAVISGGFSVEEAKSLAHNLNAGALPVPIELIGQQSIGPALGARSIEQSLFAGVIGLIAVASWMIIFYRLPGLVAAISLCLYVLLFISIIKIIPITLTLAGIAGLILSVGMAVDANVLIFERFRENIYAGKSPRYSLTDGFAEAWQSIKASNISSLITAMILYGFGTPLIRGFALTFAVGILLSMFTAISVTRTVLALAIAHPRTHTAFLLAARPRNATAANN